MIDARRWIVCEAWLRLGLQLRSIDPDNLGLYAQHDWLRDPDGRWYLFAGNRTWLVRGLGTPELATTTMLHELAHWMVSDDHERHVVNFGVEHGKDPRNNEPRAAQCEQGLVALMHACNGIANLALTGGRT
jgi:hypothetical protein